MHPELLIPTAESIPVAWGWFDFFLLLTFAMHLLLVNTLLGGGLIVLLSRKNMSGPAPQLVPRLPTLVALTVNFGVAPLLFLQVLYGPFFYCAAILSARFWMFTVLLVLLSYALFYVQAGRQKHKPVATGGLPIIFAVFFLCLVSFFFTNMMTLMIRPASWMTYFENARGTIINVYDPTLFPRWLHFLFASFAIGGLCVALVNYRPQKSDPDREIRVHLGMRWFTHASFAQIPVGIWWLLALPKSVMLVFMGDNAVGTALFIAALCTTGLALFQGHKKRVRPATGAALLTVLLMVGMRDVLRLSMLQGHFHPSSLEVTGQYTPLLFFLGCVLFMAFCLAYIFKAYRNAGGGL